MQTFKQYISEVPAVNRRMRPDDMIAKQSKDTGEKQVDFDDPAYAGQLNKALKDNEKWPPKPEAKYKADQIRWAVTAGKQPEHLANES